MRIGPIEIEKPIVLAPMEDVTDTSFRLICRRLGADLVYTEFTSSEALIRDIPKAIQKIRLTEEERPVGIQIFGSVELSVQEAVKKAEGHHPDLIDINCGCWTKRHAARGEGAGLLRDLPRMERIIKAAVRSTHLPVTVKTRLGWDQENIVILDVAKIVEQAGAKAITVHCRTRSQGYKGRADWTWLEKIKRHVAIPVIGNGDVISDEDVSVMFETGCDGVMIGRGAIDNPWIFQQARHYLKTGSHLPLPSLKERVELCIEHLKLSVHDKGPYYGTITFRKYYAGYLHDLPFAAKLRAELMPLVDLKQIVDRLYQFLEQSTAVAV